MRWAALLRGINLGKRQLKSAELKAAVETLGYTQVKTLLASGNVVFDADETVAEALEAAVQGALEKQTGLKSDIFARSPDEIAALLKANPFPEVARDRPSQLLVLFHSEAVDMAPFEKILKDYDGPERAQAVGRELFIDFPDGQGRSNLIPLMTKAKLYTGNTGRNWNTVVKIAAEQQVGNS